LVLHSLALYNAEQLFICTRILLEHAALSLPPSATATLKAFIRSFSHDMQESALDTEHCSCLDAAVLLLESVHAGKLLEDCLLFINLFPLHTGMDQGAPYLPHKIFGSAQVQASTNIFFDSTLNTLRVTRNLVGQFASASIGTLSAVEPRSCMSIKAKSSSG
jgi:hypothetical protein